MTGGLSSDSVTRWDCLVQGSRPGPRTWPTSAHDLPAAPRAGAREVPPRTPPEADIGRMRDMNASVSVQPLTKPDLPPNTAVRSVNLHTSATAPRVRPTTTPPASSLSTPHQSTSTHLWQRDRENQASETSISNNRVSKVDESHHDTRLGRRHQFTTYDCEQPIAVETLQSTHAR